MRSRYDDPGNKGRHPGRRKERTAENKSMEAEGENRLYNLQVSDVLASPELCCKTDYETRAKAKRVLPGVACVRKKAPM